MKKLLLLLSLSLGCFVLSSCSSEVKKYVIKGHVDKYESDLLMTMVNETGKVDTIHEVRSVNGEWRVLLTDRNWLFLQSKVSMGESRCCLKILFLRLI